MKPWQRVLFGIAAIPAICLGVVLMVVDDLLSDGRRP